MSEYVRARLDLDQRQITACQTPFNKAWRPPLDIVFHPEFDVGWVSVFFVSIFISHAFGVAKDCSIGQIHHALAIGSDQRKLGQSIGHTPLIPWPSCSAIYESHLHPIPRQPISSPLISTQTLPFRLLHTPIASEHDQGYLHD